MSHLRLFASRARAGLALVAATSLGGFFAACGPSAPVADAPPQQTATAGSEVSAAPTASAAPVAAHEKNIPGDTFVPAPKEGFVEVHPTGLLQSIKNAGLDPAELPTMAELTQDQRKKIMPALKKALGYESCTGCHVKGDFKAETRTKKISRKMWDEYVTNYRMKTTEPVFCDSCHGGRQQVLVRDDEKQVAAFMKSNYVGKLQHAYKQPHDCGTCHGAKGAKGAKGVKFEPRIFEKLWGIAD